MQRLVQITFIVIILTLNAAPVIASEDTVKEYFCDSESGNNRDAFAGKPISLISGAESFVRTDLTVGHLYPISVERRYNSRSGYDSPLGYGWALNYDKRLYTYPNGSVTLRKECGWKMRFIWDSSSAVYIQTIPSNTPLTTDHSDCVVQPNGERPAGLLSRTRPGTSPPCSYRTQTAPTP